MSDENQTVDTTVETAATEPAPAPEPVPAPKPRKLSELDRAHAEIALLRLENIGLRGQLLRGQLAELDAKAGPAQDLANGLGRVFAAAYDYDPDKDTIDVATGAIAARG